MERLTEHHVNKSLGAYMVCSGACIDDNFNCNGCRKLAEIVDRLAAYEDTGLEPKKVQLIANVLQDVGETYNCWFDYVVSCVLENSHLKDLAKAEKDGRLVVLPCKTGDTLWSFYNYPSSWISKIAVTAVSTIDGIIAINTDNYGVISEKDIGKTVFLTREEAEAALKRGRKRTMKRIEVNRLIYEFEDDIALMSLLDENADRVCEDTVTEKALPNAPLTLEELREMDGDKIYVHYIDGFYTDEDGAYFGKFEQLVRECNGRLTACELPLEYYGKTWLAYRRKPEEGQALEVEYAGKKIDLLPCPFCGGEPAIYSYNWLAGYHIYCTGDDCPMVPTTYRRRTLEEAAAGWNHRPKRKKETTP